MLAVADSRCQPELLREAKDAGKLARTFEIPSRCRENYPERIAAVLRPYRESGLLPSFPFGSDFTETEQQLIPALELLKDASTSLAGLARLGWKGLAVDRSAPKLAPALARLGLGKPTTLSDRLYRWLVAAALAQTKAGSV